MKINIISTTFAALFTIVVKADSVNELQAEGGLIAKPYTGKYVVIVNDQKRVPPDKLFAADGGISGLFNYPVKVVDKNAKIAKAGLVVTISDNQTAPSLLVAPEVPWAGVNVAALAIDNPKPEILTARLQKEIFRAFLYACGVANSEIQPCLMRPIFNVKDLDKSDVLQPGPSAVGPVMTTAGRLGIFEQMLMTYKEACQQGWAPAPTNEYQKAIWDKVHTIPSNPMKIKYKGKK